MVTRNFSLDEDLILTEWYSGIQLKMLTDQEPAEDYPGLKVTLD